MHALSFNCLKEEMIDSSSTVVAYHTDGSRVHGTDSFCVEGIAIDRTFRRLPFLPICSESRDNNLSL